MPREFPEWVRTAQALMLLTFAEHQPYPRTWLEMRRAIGETAIRHDAEELGATLIQLEDEHLKFLTETGCRRFMGIDDLDSAEDIAAKFATGQAGAADHMSNG